MDFSKNSHLRSLVPAVLVGLLALAANAYTKMDPRVLRNAVQSVEKRIHQLGKKKKVRPKPAEDLELLRKIDSAMTDKFSKWKRHRHRVTDGSLQKTIDRANEICLRIEQAPGLQPTQIRDMLITQMCLLFKAARMNPESFSEEFDAIAAKVEANASETDAEHAALLRFYHRIEFNNPDQEALLASMQQFAEQNSAASGIRLYSLVAEEFVANKRHGLARSVLQKGVSKYSDSPGVSQLTNQLIDLGGAQVQRKSKDEQGKAVGFRHISRKPNPSKPRLRARSGRRPPRAHRQSIGLPRDRRRTPR